MIKYLNVYICKNIDIGYIGGNAVVVARSKKAAAGILNGRIQRHCTKIKPEFSKKYTFVKESDMECLDKETEHAIILSDGDY